jgi:hypothetical protein
MFPFKPFKMTLKATIQAIKVDRLILTEVKVKNEHIAWSCLT